ncbi:NADH-quinone oxidoreductase subunit 5 family protein [Nonomuraea sp. KM90]|uniref:NADH-quinone oxidoreductase subunit 5 family protein n=1 Tax=Nonomuraea sp. KM90 TaxID=3457428 RepID=UPI003FCDEFD2
MSALLWLLPLLPIGAGGALLLVRRAGRAVAIPVAALTLALAAHAAVTRPAVTTRLLLQEGLAVDGLSAVMVITVAAAGLAVLVFAAGELREARFHGLMLIFLGAMLVTVTATDLLLLLMGWEVMGAMSYALIGYWWHEPGRVRSGTVAFLTTRAGDLGLYFAAGAAMAGGGALLLSGLPQAPWRDLVAGGIVLAALGKSAQLPFSFWLSRAMAGPSPVSALLHSATMVAAGAYLLLRVQPLLAATGWAEAVVTWAGALTALLLGAVAVAQRDLKQLLAASTCAQLGFMVVAAGLPAVAGGVVHLVAHAAVKSLLFLGAGAWLSALGTEELRGLGGAGRRYPVVGVAFGVGAVALAGVPPLSLWVTKDTILGAVREPGLYAVLLVAALLAAAYSARALVAVWGRPAGGRPPGRAVTGWERAPMPVLALAAAGLGVVGVPGVFEAWGRLVGDPGAAAPTIGGLALSGGLALAVVAAVILIRPGTVVVPARRAGGVLGGWLGLERAAVVLVARPVMALARTLARFDDRVLDAGVHGAARAGRAVAGAAGAFDDRAVDAAVAAVPRAGLGAARIVRAPFEAGLDGAVRAVAATAGRLGALARRPQTGQVHLYFAQAAVALIVLAVAFAILR